MSQGLAWIYLLMSAIIDVAWALSMKKADGFRHLEWTMLSMLLLAAFVYFLTRALTVLPMGTSYAVWTGIGAAGTVTFGVVLFDEPVTPLRIGCILVILSGVIGLHLAST